MFGIIRNISTRLHILLVLAYLSNLRPASAAPQNITVDDQDFSLFTYRPAGNWSHDPLLGWEHDFYGDSRSYTWLPNAYVSFTFTGACHSAYLASDRDRRYTITWHNMHITFCYDRDNLESDAFSSSLNISRLRHLPPRSLCSRPSPPKYHD